MKVFAGLAVALLASAFLASSATAADNKELIVGKWTPAEAQGKGIEAVIEFTKDGKIKVAVKAEGFNLDLGGSYKFIDDKTLETTVDDPQAKGKSKTEKSTIKSISADELVITNAQGKDEKFKKVK